MSLQAGLVYEYLSKVNLHGLYDRCAGAQRHVLSYVQEDYAPLMHLDVFSQLATKVYTKPFQNDEQRVGLSL